MRIFYGVYRAICTAAAGSVEVSERNSEQKRARIGALVIAVGLTLALAGCKDKNDTSASNGSSRGSAATSVGSGGSGGGATGGSGSGGGEIVIGEYASFTGPQADFGHQTDQGIKQAFEEVNAAGGIDVAGKKMTVKLETEDDASDATKADTAVKRLVDEKNVIAVLGEVASSCSLAGGKVCQDKGVPMISPSSTNVNVTVGRDYVFRVCFLDSYQAAVVARFAHDGLKANTAAIFTNKGEAYSVGFSDEFEKAFVKYGGKIAAKQTYGSKDQDFRSSLTALKAANPDVILVPGYYGDSGQIVKQARDQGINIPILGGDGWSSSQLLTIGGSAVNGCYFSDHMSIKDPRPTVQNFVSGYKKKYNVDPTSMSALGYDAAKILFASISRAKSTGKKAIRDAIAQTRDFDGVSGNISIDENRNAKKSAVMIAVKNNSFDYAATIPDPDQPMPAK